MSDSNHIRLQRDIEKIEGLVATHGEDLAVLKSIILGNGRPGLLKLLESSSCTIEGINKRLMKVEHQNKYTKARDADIWTTTKNIVYIAAFLMSVGLNVFLLVKG